jgi:NIPSNAP
VCVRHNHVVLSLAMTLNKLTVFGVALASFAAGSLFTARVRADSNRVFELRVYHTVPGKAQALQAEFRDKVTHWFAKYDMKAVGYWAPVDAPASDNTFIYILAHPSREEAKKHWAAFQADPAFQEMIKSQQGDAKQVEKIDSTYMAPTDFSPLK